MSIDHVLALLADLTPTERGQVFAEAGRRWKNLRSLSAAALGRRGGAATSARKTEAARANGRLGGRPPKTLRAASSSERA